MADYLEDRYILSIKAHPGTVARPRLDGEAVRHGIRQALEITRGCVVEIIMKDNHTIGGRPANLVEWCAIAKEEAQRIASW
jgi:hypothetical protein